MSEKALRKPQFSLKWLLIVTLWAASLLTMFLGSPVLGFSIFFLSLTTVISISWGNLRFGDGLALSVVLLLILLMFFDPLFNFRSGRRRGRPPCMNNLRNLGLAILNFESSRSCYPAAQIVSADGTPLHSWRSQLLPYVELTQLYDSIDFSKSWLNPINDKPRSTVVDGFRCPDAKLKRDDVKTSYIGIVGKETIWKPDGVSTKISAVTDGTSNTILVVESDRHRTPWMSPNDLTFDQLKANLKASNYELLSSPHTGGSFVTLADGSCRYIPNTISDATLEALLTIGSGDSIGDLE